MQHHHLKIHHIWLDALRKDEKSVEIRRHDRDFQKGDVIVYSEYIDQAGNPQPLEEPMEFMIKHVLSEIEGLEPMFVALSVQRIIIKDLSDPALT